MPGEKRGMVDLNAKKNKDIKKQTKPNQPGKKNKKKLKSTATTQEVKKPESFYLRVMLTL